MSSLVISAVTEAAGCWSIRVMLPWTATCSTVAMVASGTFVTVPTGSALSASTDATSAGSTWTMTLIVCPSGDWMVVAVCATSADRTWFETCAALIPTAIALFGSTVTWTSGVAFTRSLLRLARSGWSASAATTASVPLATSTELGPVTLIRRPFEVKPPPDDTATS